MSFAKHAAEELVNPEAELERQEKHNRWKKYLAAAAGLGTLGLGGYLAYKNWPSISHALDKATSTLPEEGAIERTLKAPGFQAGGIIGAALPEVNRIFGTTLGNSIAGLTNSSRSAHENSPIAKALNDFKERLKGSKEIHVEGGNVKNLHSAFEPAMAQPGGQVKSVDPLVDVANLGAGKAKYTAFSNPNNYHILDPRRYWQDLKSRGEMGSLLRGLDTLHNAPGDVHTPLRSALVERFGSDLGMPGNLKETLNHTRSLSTSPHPLGSRLLRNGALGAGLGALVDHYTNAPVE